MNDSAIILQDVSKSYGKGSKTHLVLCHLNMVVPKGYIYGLLGSSGCGKTTLLSCIVGIRKVDDGTILVMNKKINNCGLDPRIERKIGYMPQDIGLIEEFSIIEQITYFGYIYGLNEKQIMEKYKFLNELLELPPSDRLVKNCSGGQKRRISLAATLVHDPDLLILDEPTVGLDPILSDNIWKYLVDISTKKHATIIITTHYIEEAKQANQIGLMRGGEILVEESPSTLLNLFKCETLEKVFLILSEKQTKGEHAPELSTVEYIEKREKIKEKVNRVVEFNNMQTNEKSRHKQQFSKKRLKALVFKNRKQSIRNPSHLLFTFLFPLIQLWLFFNAIGGELNNLSLGIINNELSWDECTHFNISSNIIPLPESLNTTAGCTITRISCFFLNSLNETKTKKVFFNSFEEATKALKLSKIYGIIEIPQNFSFAFDERLDAGIYLDDNLIDSSQIKVWVDDNDFQTIQTLKLELFQRYMDFMTDVAKKCNFQANVFRLPIRIIDPPIYGHKNQTARSFMAPGFLLVIVYLCAMVTTSTILITERLEGIWARNLVAGITTSEILTTHVVTQVLLSIIPVIVVIVSISFFYDIETAGPISNVIIYFFSVAWNGILHGILISIVSPDYDHANFISTGSFLPITLVSGIIWPIEGMPYLMQKFCLLLPFTYPNTTMRYIMLRGWSFSNSSVVVGLMILTIWSAIYLVITFIVLKRKM